VKVLIAYPQLKQVFIDTFLQGNIFLILFLADNIADFSAYKHLMTYETALEVKKLLERYLKLLAFDDLSGSQIELLREFCNLSFPYEENPILSLFQRREYRSFYLQHLISAHHDVADSLVLIEECCRYNYAEALEILLEISKTCCYLTSGVEDAIDLCIKNKHAESLRVLLQNKTYRTEIAKDCDLDSFVDYCLANEFAEGLALFGSFCKLKYDRHIVGVVERNQVDCARAMINHLSQPFYHPGNISKDMLAVINSAEVRKKFNGSSLCEDGVKYLLQTIKDLNP
jgi:hypothetical protein